MQSINTFRIAYENWADEARFRELLGMFARRPDLTHRLALLSASTHAPLPLAEVERRAEIMRARIALAKSMEYACGINLLCTVGHHEEDLKSSLQGSYTHMTNTEGAECAGSYCFRDERYLEGYVEPVYRMLAQTIPDFIWTDDDVRCGHMPIGAGCFCDGCVARFLAENGLKMDRRQLLERLDAFDVELRRKWLAFTSESIARLLDLIRRTVVQVDGGIGLGFMTGERYYEGYDFADWADKLSGGGASALFWRPGGGAYQDDYLSDILDKAAEIGRQTAYLPDYVTLRHSEIESFPYQTIRKSPRTSAIEACLYLSKGCNGTAFNILPSDTGEALGVIDGHLNLIERYTPFFELLIETFDQGSPVGIHSGWHPHNQALTEERRWVDGYGGTLSKRQAELYSLGLPEAYRADRACAWILSNKAPMLLTDDEILRRLSGGVYLDAGAIRALAQRGFSELIGFGVGREFPIDAREEYLPVSFNDGFHGHLRNCRQAFLPGDAFELLPAAGAVPLSRLVDYHSAELAACTMGVYRNKLGGRVCAAGYYPFSQVSFSDKARQLKRIFRYLSHDRLPLYVHSYERILNAAHFTRGGKVAAALFNINIHALEEVKIRMKTSLPSIALYRSDRQKMTLNKTGEDGAYAEFVVPKIDAWDAVLVREE